MGAWFHSNVEIRVTHCRCTTSVSQQLVHRRLGVRNVLLKSDNVGGIVAKVAGFGPTRGEVQTGDKVDVRVYLKPLVIILEILCMLHV